MRQAEAALENEEYVDDDDDEPRAPRRRTSPTKDDEDDEAAEPKPLRPRAPTATESRANSMLSRARGFKSRVAARARSVSCEPSLSDAVRERARKAHEMAAAPVATDSAEHAQLLRRLWSATHPDPNSKPPLGEFGVAGAEEESDGAVEEAAAAVPSPRPERETWRWVGFQNDSPVRSESVV